MMMTWLTILFLLFPGFGYYHDLYQIALTEHLFVRFEQQIAQQVRFLQDNPVELDLSPARIFPMPPTRKDAWSEMDLPVRSGLAVDLQSNQQLFAKNADQPMAIASITKLMTALVFLEHNPGWDVVYKVLPEDRREGGRIRLYTADQLTTKDLFYASLVGSENTAITGLVNLTGLSEQAFVEEMNQKAKSLRMYDTSFVDPTGLSPENKSTARDVFKLVRTAIQNDEIKKAVLTGTYRFQTKEGQEKVFESTDDLLGQMPGNIKILGGKTGYLEEGGYCFAAMFEQDGHQVITVVLGADDRWQRFTQTERLLNWVFQGYDWPEIK